MSEETTEEFWERVELRHEKLSQSVDGYANAEWSQCQCKWCVPRRHEQHARVNAENARITRLQNAAPKMIEALEAVVPYLHRKLDGQTGMCLVCNRWHGEHDSDCMVGMADAAIVAARSQEGL